jgi:hypothetical protein
MQSRPKLTAAPLAYAMWKVEGTQEPYGEFGRSLWAAERAVALRLKELVFLRASIVNECVT